MTDTMTWGIAGYIVFQFAVGVWVSRKVRTETDYILAGRRLGMVLATFSIFATWFGAETVVGAAGAIYEAGLSGGSADPFGYVLSVYLMGVFFAVPLWRAGYTTFADLYRARYSPTVERLTIALLVPSSIIWAAAQIRAFGQVISLSTQWRVDYAIMGAAAVVIGYTAVGGLLADAWTDLIQGIVLAIGLLVIGISVWWHVPAGTLADVLHSDRLMLFDRGADSPWAAAESWAVPMIGSVMAVELVSRILACRCEVTARNSCLLGGTVYLVLGLIPVGIGLVGPALLPGLTEAEQLVPQLARAYLGPTFYILFGGALISAILSTVDSALLASASLVSHNLLKPVLPQMSDAHQVLVARLSVATFGVIALALALQSNTIGRLVSLASAFGGAGYTVVAAFGMYTKWGGPLAALVTIVSSVACWAIAKYYGATAPFLLSLAVSLVLYIVLATVETYWARPAHQRQ